MRKHLIILVAFALSLALGVRAQEYHGTTGLLHAPSAVMDSAGTFRGSFTYVDKLFLPPQFWFYGDGIPFNSMCYTIGMTLFPWLEMSYTGTLIKVHPDKAKREPLGYYNEDRHINVKLRPLKEGRYWPAVAIGWDDAGGLSAFKTKGWTTNNFFENLYGVVSKHFDIRGHVLGAHLAYRYYPSDKNAARRGIAGGITYTPYLGEKLQHPRAWLQRPRVIVEWDGVGVNAGADVLLWRHLFVQAALIHGRGFMGGVGYHYRIKY